MRRVNLKSLNVGTEVNIICEGEVIVNYDKVTGMMITLSEIERREEIEERVYFIAEERDKKGYTQIEDTSLVNVYLKNSSDINKRNGYFQRLTWLEEAKEKKRQQEA